MSRKGWWVHSVAVRSGHRSKVGPYKTAVEAALYAQHLVDDKELGGWTRVAITFNKRGGR